MKRVVVTGIGALTPIGNTVEAYWKNLVAGVNGAGPITKFNAEKFKTRYACELKGFDPLNYMDKNEIRRNDLFAQYGLVVAEEAIKDAALDLSKIDRTMVGVIWGSGNGGITTFQQQVEEFSENGRTPRFNPFLVPKMIVNMASGIISMKFGLQGMNYTTVSACASGNSAIMDAFNYIRWGKANVIVAGGSEAAITESAIGGFGAMKALSTRNDITASRPFDTERDGFVMGEGAGALILEEYEHAIKRGAPIIAEMAGASMTADAYHLTATHPEGEGATRAMKLALEDAGLTPGDVDYLNMHATSTPTGDISETKAASNFFGENAKNLHISATKSMTGHLLGAAGAIEGIAVILAIRDGIVPPTINTKNVDSEVSSDLNIVFDKAYKKQVDVAMSNTFGFGGHNAIVVFKRFEN
ncbi:MAG: beta-ketoacyl-ACP synthase II [Bacteroidota bacterium]|nr:beta-ketoacyl-ACP synthase II [Bacteroidota bacterium]